MAEPDQQHSNPAMDWLKSMLTTMLPGLIMFFLGFMLIQSVEQDLKRESFTASSADKLKSYVTALIVVDPATSKEELEATALALGGFGSVASVPLIGIIERGGATRISAGKLGLEQAGHIAPERTCEAMATVIDDATDTYKWQTRKAVVEVAGRVGCEAAEGPLSRLLDQIDSMDINAEQKKNFRLTVGAAQARIEGATRRRSGFWPW